MNQITQQITSTFRWMVDEMNNRRRETGMVDEPVSAEMQLAETLLAGLESGHIKCYTKLTEVST